MIPIKKFIDPIINKEYWLYQVNARWLSNELKSIYSKHYNIPNLGDFTTDNSNEETLMKYENNFISILADYDYLIEKLEGNIILMDGYRRLFMSNVPDVDVFLKVYDSKNITIEEELKLMLEFNYWKKFNTDSDCFFERGFSLWIYLKTAVNITSIIDELKTYLDFNDYVRNKNNVFENLLYENVNLFDDIKFINQLKHRKVSFNIRKKEYKDLKPPIGIIYALSNLRYKENKYNPINIENFYTDILNVESFKTLVVEYNEATIYDKKNRCLSKAHDFLLNYIKTEYFGFKKEKSVIELQEEIKKKIDEIKKDFTLIKSISDSKLYSHYRDRKYDIQKFLDEIKNSDYIIWVKGVNMKELNTDTKIRKIKYTGDITKEITQILISREPKNINFLVFEDIETGEKFEWTIKSMSYGSQKFYRRKDDTIDIKTKRPPFVIYNFNDFKDRFDYLVKAKTINRVVELLNEHGHNVNTSHVTLYCHNLTTHEEALELTKDITEGIVKWKN